MKDWELKLKGDREYLALLAEKLASSELEIRCLDEGYVLKLGRYKESQSEQVIHDQGVDLVKFLNNSAKIFSGRHEPIETDGFWSVDSKGNRKKEFYWIGRISVPLRFIGIGNEIVPIECFRLWRENEIVRYVLHLAGSDQFLGWFVLYKIFETIKDDDAPSLPKGKKKIEQWMGASKTECFSVTANLERHSQHGKKADECKKSSARTLDLSEGNNFIRGLVMKWLQSKIEMTPRSI